MQLCIVAKEIYRLSAERKFRDINVNLTAVGNPHLGAVIKQGIIEKNIANKKTKSAAEWKKELEIWTKISSSEFKTVNCACVS